MGVYISMSHLMKKIAGRLHWTYNLIKSIRFFGIRYTYYKFVSLKVYNKDREKGLKLFSKRYKLTKAYIMRKYGYIIREAKNISLPETLIDNACCVWIFWWQGEARAPELVQNCINSIRKYSSSHKVIVISSSNYAKYIDLSNIILDKVHSGQISLTHLSDLVRCKLLWKYGGIWCDATILMTSTFDNSIFQYPFYSIKHDLSFIPQLEIEPSHCRWRSFFLASAQGNRIFQIISTVLMLWLESNVPLIDYFTIDYLIWLISEQSENIREIIDAVPANNQTTYWLAKNLNHQMDFKTWSEIRSENYLHKLSYKIIIKNEDGTFYDYIIRKMHY